jgi:hypothetical protein
VIVVVEVGGVCVKCRGQGEDGYHPEERSG